MREGDICIDATAGNGRDTEVLCELVGGTGKVYAFDIQEIALENTRKRLEEAGLLGRVRLILAGHEKMADVVDEREQGEVSCVVFNFGYLPGGDYEIATKAETSILAIKQALNIVKKGGLVSLCIYSGGNTGFEEREGILGWLKSLDSKRYIVVVNEFYNRDNYPPLPVIILKR